MKKTRAEYSAMRNDAVARTLLRRVRECLALRPDDDWNRFRQAIRRSRSWISEFQHGKRTTNDLRLTLKIARYFGVPIDYLVSDTTAAEDPGAVMLMGAWRELGTREREAVLRLALTLRPPKEGPPTPDRGPT